MTGMARRVLLHQPTHVLTVREHGIKRYYAILNPDTAGRARTLRQAKRSHMRAVDYRVRVLERLARRRRWERSLRGRLGRLWHGRSG